MKPPGQIPITFAAALQFMGPKERRLADDRVYTRGAPPVAEPDTGALRGPRGVSFSRTPCRG